MKTKDLSYTSVFFSTTVNATSIAWMKVAILYVKNPTNIGINSKCINPYSGTRILHRNTTILSGESVSCWICSFHQQMKKELSIFSTNQLNKQIFSCLCIVCAKIIILANNTYPFHRLKTMTSTTGTNNLGCAIAPLR